MSWVAGVDGCRSGWVIVLHELGQDEVRLRVVPDFDAVLALAEAPVAIGVDMIIGLPDCVEPGGRVCDVEARRRLGWPRAGSVFSPPARAALAQPTYDQAQAVNRAHSTAGNGLSVQTYHLLPKIREVDRRMTPALQARVREVHPELSFYEMNGGRPLAHGKRTAAGRAERLACLATAGLGDLAGHRIRGAAADDVLDAAAACWTARRIHAGTAEPLPARARCDARGLRMQIWR